MRIYRGSDADIVLRPFMVRLSEIVSFDLQLWTSGTYMVKRSTSESGMTTDKGNNLINVHFTDKETGYLDAGVLNAKLMYRITDSEYPDGTYDGIITIPQEYYLMTPPDFSGATIEKVYESGYTEGYNTAIQNSVLSINGEKGDLKLKTVNGNELLGEGNINIKALKYFELTQERAREAYNEIQNHWDDKSGYTGDFIFYYKKENGGVYTFSEIGYLKDHSVYFNYLNNAGAYDVNTGNIKFFAIIIWKDGYNLQTYEHDFTIPTKTSQVTNDSTFQTKSEVDTAIENAISGVGGVESLNNQTGALKIKTIDNKDVLGEGNMDILSDYNICMFMMYNLTLSEADKGIIVYKYGIGDDAANLDKYFSGFKTIQFLHFNIKDGASYKVPVTIFWDGDGNRQFRFVCEGYEYTYTSIDANYCDFTSKVKVGGDQNVIVLDGLTQEERKAVYDKIDKTKPIDAVFVYNNSTSIRTAWDGRDIYFYCITEEENGIKYQAYYFSSDGTIGGQAIIPKITNSLIINVNEHINESDNFNCGYIGSFQNYLVEPFTRPNAYFILFKKGYGANTKSVYAPFTAVWDKDFEDNNYQATPVTIQFTIDGITYRYRNDLTNQNTWQYDGKISIYDSHSINGFNGTSLVLGDAALDATDKNKYIDMRAMMGHDTIFNGDNDGSCPYLTIITTDNQMYKVPVWVKCNKQNDSTTRATFEFDLNGYHYLYTQDNQGDLTYSFTSKTPIGGGTSGDVPTKVSQLENDSKYISNSNTDGGVNKMWTGTQAEYDAIDPKDNSTIYIVDGKYIYWQGKVIGGGTGVAGVSSVNGKTGDVKLKTINNIDLTNGVDISPNIKIVQPFLEEAGFRCGLNFNFKIDESGNETIESVRPQGYKKIDVGGIKKNRFFQYFQGGDSPQYAQIGLYEAVFTTYAGDSGAHPSQLTYGTINTWGNTHIDNTDDPESEDYFGYYVSFTVISPYTFTKYDVTVLSYYVTAEIENTNTWKIIWKKAN